MNLVQRAGATLQFGVNETTWSATGVLVTKVSNNITGDKVAAKDGQGKTIAVNYTDDKQEVTFSGFVNGTPTFARGDVVNVTPEGGTAHNYIVESVNRSEDNGKFREIELKLERYIDGNFP